MLQHLFNRYPNIKLLARKLISVVPQSLRFGEDFWHWYAFYNETEQWTGQQLVNYQMERLRDLLARLVKTSPFYRARLGAMDILSLDRVAFQQMVPTLARQDFRENYAAIRSGEFKAHRLTTVRTSGTTGMALQFHHHKADGAREWAAICHQWKRVGYIPGKSRRTEFCGLTSAGQLVERFPDRNMIRCSIIDFKTEHVLYYADQIKRYQTDFYHGYPSALYLLSKEINRSKIKFPQPKAVLLASEVVYDWQLEQIRTAFPNAKLFAHYGCAERTVLGGWCEYRQEYHILPQYSMVEIDPVTREIIGTNLFNDINGFVRYRMTDTVLEYSQETCPDCGRPYLPRIMNLGGRSEEYLYSPEHGWIPPAIVTYPLKSLKAVREVQFFQREKNTLIVYFTTYGTNDAPVQADLEQMEHGLHRLFGADMKLDFERVDDFARGPTGKFKWIRCEMEERP